MQKLKKLSPQAVRHASKLARLTAVDEPGLALSVGGGTRTDPASCPGGCGHYEYPASA